MDLEFDIIESGRKKFHEGEAVYALSRFYGISQEEKYLKAAKKGMDYFVLNHYEQYEEHWISYSVNEITKYVDQKEYFDLGITNYLNKKEKLLEKEDVSQTDMELLMNTWEIYKRVHREVDSDLLDLIQKGMESRIRNFIFPEEAMYFENSKKYQETFCVKGENYRVRIDDVQHSLSGVYLFYMNIAQLWE